VLNFTKLYRKVPEDARLTYGSSWCRLHVMIYVNFGGKRVRDEGWTFRGCTLFLPLLWRPVGLQQTSSTVVVTAEMWSYYRRHCCLPFTRIDDGWQMTNTVHLPLLYTSVCTWPQSTALWRHLLVPRLYVACKISIRVQTDRSDWISLQFSWPISLQDVNQICTS